MQALQYQRDQSSRDQNPAEMPLELIDGTFSPSELRDMLFALLNSQINSYKVKNWKSQVNQECPDGDCMSKMSELNEAKRILNELCEEARIYKKDLRVRSRITVEFIDKE